MATVFKSCNLMGYCLGCGKPTHPGDIKIESGRGKNRHIITWHNACYESEYKKEVKYDGSAKKSK